MPLMEAGAPTTIKVPRRPVKEREAPAVDKERGHRWRLRLAIVCAAGLILSLGIIGFPYYRGGPEERLASPLHAMLRSTGWIGLRLGMLGAALFGVLFLYPLRKRWRWLSRIGATRHWLDFHVVCGITAPLVITFHSSFHFHGLAGLAYWIMIAVALSGFVGRYVYAQIPRSMNHAKLSAAELAAQTSEMARRLAEQPYFQQSALEPLLRAPSDREIRSTHLLGLLWKLLLLDLARPLDVSRLRRRALSGSGRVLTLGGLLRCRHEELEAVIATARRLSRLSVRMTVLDRTERIFHLWHVIHRPFSFSFVLLVVIHVSLAILLGYY